MLLELTCAECGGPFSYHYRNGRKRKTCSEPCRQARRQRQIDAFYERQKQQRCPTCGQELPHALQ
jgi:hypothetical protein